MTYRVLAERDLTPPMTWTLRPRSGTHAALSALVALASIVVGLIWMSDTILKSPCDGELDADAGWNGSGLMLLVNGFVFAGFAFVAARRRVRIVLDRNSDELLVYVSLLSRRTIPCLFRPDPRARFVLLEGEKKGTIYLTFDGGIDQGLHRLCSASSSLVHRLTAVNEVLAALPPRLPR